MVYVGPLVQKFDHLINYENCRIAILIFSFYFYVRFIAKVTMQSKIIFFHLCTNLVKIWQFVKLLFLDNFLKMILHYLHLAHSLKLALVCPHPSIHRTTRTSHTHRQIFFSSSSSTTIIDTIFTFFLSFLSFFFLLVLLLIFETNL